MPGLNVDFAKTGPFYALNGLLSNNGLTIMFEAKDYPSVNAIFNLVGYFADILLGPSEIHESATVPRCKHNS